MESGDYIPMTVDTADPLWIKYLSLGGSADPLEVEAHIHALLRLPEHERIILDHALWELSKGW
jgi:hypothetical protein